MDPTNDYILIALGTIKETYISLKNVIKMKDKEIEVLKLRNEELMKVVEFCRQGQQSGGFKYQQGLINDGTTYDDLDITPDDLNVALNNSINCSFSDSKQEDEMLNVNFIPKENKESTTVRYLKSSIKEKQGLADAENIEPKGLLKRNGSGWLQKDKNESTGKSFSRAVDHKKFIWDENNIKQPAEYSRENRMINTPQILRKKLKQARLTNYSIRRSSVIKPNFSNFVKDSSLMEHDAANIEISSITSRKSEDLAAEDSTDHEHFQAQKLEDESDFFDYTMKAYDKEVSKKNPTKEPTTVSPNQSTKDFYCSSSVIILSPAKPETILVEESYQDSTCIESMDLLQEVLKNGDQSLNTLKRVESAKIRELQKSANLSANRRDNRIKPPASPNFAVNRHPISRIKEENKTEKAPEPVSKIETAERNLFDESSSETEDFMPQPILVKTEKNENEKLQAEKKVNVDLKKGSLNKSTNSDVFPTPEGFWDPFIRSFDVNDPRNETLIDSRLQYKQL